MRALFAGLLLLSGSLAAQEPSSEEVAREAAATWVRALAAKDRAQLTALATAPFEWRFDDEPRKRLGKGCKPGVRVTTRKQLSAVIGCLVKDARFIAALGRAHPARFAVHSASEFFRDASWPDEVRDRFAGHVFVSFFLQDDSPGGLQVVIAVRQTKAGPRVAGFGYFPLGDI